MCVAILHATYEFRRVICGVYNAQCEEILLIALPILIHTLAISEVNMQLIVRGEQTHVLDVAPTANVEALRAQLSLLEVILISQKIIPPMS